MKHHLHIISFKHAWDGLIYAVTSQPNFLVHFLFAACAIFAGKYFGISKIEWIILALVITLVLVAEMLNTAVESMTDLITLEYREYAKRAKDVAAGMVLLVAGLSVIIGLVIFLPYL